MDTRGVLTRARAGSECFQCVWNWPSMTNMDPDGSEIDCTGPSRVLCVNKKSRSEPMDTVAIVLLLNGLLHEDGESAESNTMPHRWLTRVRNSRRTAGQRASSAKESGVISSLRVPCEYGAAPGSA
eukprot:3929969-Rhodomonas_salina.2